MTRANGQDAPLKQSAFAHAALARHPPSLALNQHFAAGLTEPQHKEGGCGWAPSHRRNYLKLLSYLGLRQVSIRNEKTTCAS